LIPSVGNLLTALQLEYDDADTTIAALKRKANLIEDNILQRLSQGDIMEKDTLESRRQTRL